MTTDAQAKSMSVFFYGSFISLDVLAERGFVPDAFSGAPLDGYDIVIRPLATLVRRDDMDVYGLLATGARADVDRLYGEQWVWAYRPYPVTVVTSEGARRDAVCYIAAPGEGNPAAGYVQRIIDSARDHGFPDAYVERLERCLPQT